MSLPLAIVAEPSPCDTRRLLLIDGDTERAHDFARAIAEESTVLVCVDDADVERVRTIAPDVVNESGGPLVSIFVAALAAFTSLMGGVTLRSRCASNSNFRFKPFRSPNSSRAV